MRDVKLSLSLIVIRSSSRRDEHGWFFYVNNRHGFPLDSVDERLDSQVMLNLTDKCCCQKHHLFSLSRVVNREERTHGNLFV